jgi:pimeloyl-ACP methyl ester carboxylesterase
MGFQTRSVRAALWTGLATALAIVSCASQGRAPQTRLVDIGSHRLEMRDQGTGSPVIVLEAGLSDTMDKLAPLQARLARITRVVAYNRAGYGGSEPGPLPRDAGREADELRALLEKAEIPGPYILAGHSLGALSVQAFATKSPGEVAGMALLDPPPLSFLMGREYPELGAMAEKMTGEWQAIADSSAGSRRAPASY